MPISFAYLSTSSRKSTAIPTTWKPSPERVRWIEEKIKLGRIGELEDIMGPVTFLASDAANYINGHALVVDGGWRAK